MQIFLAVGVAKLPDIDEFIDQSNTTNLGLIRDAVNSMAMQAKKGASLLAEICRN